MGNKQGKKANEDHRIVGTASVFQKADILFTNVGYSGDFRCKYLCFDHDETLGLLAVGNSKGAVTFFGKCGVWKRLTVAMNQILIAVEFLRYERKLLTMTEEGSIYEIDIQKMSSRQMRFEKFFQDHFSFFTPTFGDRNIFLGAKDGSLSLFDLRQGKFNELEISPLNKEATTVLRLESNRQHPYLYLLIYDAMEVFIYDIQRGEVAEKFTHHDNFRSGAWCADGKHVVLGCDDGQFLLCQTQNKLMRSDPIKFSLTDDAVRLPVYDIKAYQSQKGSRFWCSGGNAKSQKSGLVSLIQTEDYKTFQTLSQISPIFGGTAQSLCIVNSFVFFGANSLNLARFDEKTRKSQCALIDGSLLNKSQLFSIIDENHHALLDHIGSTHQKWRSLLPFALHGGFDDDSDPETVKYAITGRGFKIQFWIVYNDLEQFELLYTLNIAALASRKLPAEELKTISAAETSAHAIAVGFQSGHVVVVDYELNDESPCVHCFSVHTSPIKFIRFASFLRRVMLVDQSNALSVGDLETGETPALEMLSDSDADITQVTIAPLMATREPGDVCFWIGYSDGTFKVFDCQRCQEWKLADSPPLKGSVLKLFIVDAIGRNLSCVEPEKPEIAPAMQEVPESAAPAKKAEGAVQVSEDIEQKKVNVVQEPEKIINQQSEEKNEAEQAEGETVQTQEVQEKADEVVQEAEEEEVQAKEEAILATPVGLEAEASEKESTEAAPDTKPVKDEKKVENTKAPDQEVVQNLSALGFIDPPKEVTKKADDEIIAPIFEKKRSAERSASEQESEKEVDDSKRAPEVKTQEPGITPDSKEEVVPKKKEKSAIHSEGWLIVTTTKAVYTIGLLPSKYAFKKNEDMPLDGIVDCALLDSSYRTALVILTKTHFSILRLMDMSILSTIPHRLPTPTTLFMYQSGWWICKTSNKRFYHGTFLFDEDTRDFSLPQKVTQPRTFTPPTEKARSEGWLKKKSLPSIEEVMTTHKRRKPRRSSKPPRTKEDQTLSGVNATKDKMNENLRKAAERGQKISEMADKSAALADKSDKFASLAKRLRQQQESSWF